jgi:hypothetical protein
MTKRFKKFSSPLILALCTVMPLNSVFADGLTPDQRKELFIKGTITDKKTHKVWNVILVPGADNITNGAKGALGDAKGDFTALGTKDFWIDRGQDIQDGFTFSKDSLSFSTDSLKFSRDVVKKDWLGGIKEDYQETVEENKTIVPGEIGSDFSRVVSWGWFGMKAIGRTIWLPLGTAGGVAGAAGGVVGAAGGVAYSIVAPAAITLGKPIIGGLLIDGAGRSAVVPAMAYIWNGVAWVGDSFGNVPTQESFFINLQYQDPKTGEQTMLVIDNQGFQTLVQASALQAMTDAQRAQLQAQVDAIQTQIEQTVKPLQQKQKDLNEQSDEAYQKFNDSAAEQALRTLYGKAMDSTNVTMSPDAKDAYMDQAKLRLLVVNYLKSMGVASPSDEMVDGICKNVGDTLNGMRVQMAQVVAPAKKK